MRTLRLLGIISFISSIDPNSAHPVRTSSDRDAPPTQVHRSTKVDSEISPAQACVNASSVESRTISISPSEAQLLNALEEDMTNIPNCGQPAFSTYGPSDSGMCRYHCLANNAICVNVDYNTMTAENDIFFLITEAVGYVQDRIRSCGYTQEASNHFISRADGLSLQLWNRSGEPVTWGIVLAELTTLWSSMSRYGYGSGYFTVYVSDIGGKQKRVAFGAIG